MDLRPLGNMHTVNNLEMVAGLFLWLAVIFSFVLTGVLARRLRTRHQKIWDELGSPRFFLGNSLRNTYLLSRWLWRFEYRHCGDSRLTALAIALQVVQVAGALAGVSLLVAYS